MTQSGESNTELLWRAWLAGYDFSGEGHNGEYQAGCHNMPHDDHVHEDWLLEALRGHFEKWLLDHGQRQQR